VKFGDFEEIGNFEEIFGKLGIFVEIRQFLIETDHFYSKKNNFTKNFFPI
jgi:hypothetical protein